MSYKAHFKNYWSVYSTLLFFGGLVALYFLSAEFQGFIDEGWEVFASKDEVKIAAWFESFGFWGPVIIILLMVIQMFLIVFPTWLPMIVAVLAYGAIWGVIISVSAVFLASTLGYIIGKHLSNPVENKLVSKKNFDKLSGFMDDHGFGAIVLFRISPFLSNDAISFIAGFMKMNYQKFIQATLAGIVPLAIVIAYFSREIETLKSGLYWVGGFGVLLYILFIIIQKRS